MALNDTAKATALSAIVAEITHLSLHTDAVGGGSGNEVTGGSPAYARKTVSWGAPSAGSIATSANVIFDVPAGTVRRVGFFGAASGTASYRGDADITDEVFAAQGTYQVNSGSSIAITG